MGHTMNTRRTPLRKPRAFQKTARNKIDGGIQCRVLSVAAVNPPIDSGFIPAVLWNREFRRLCTAASEPIAIALERPDGTVSRFETRILPHTDANCALNFRYVERLVKMLLWSRGGFRIFFGGNKSIAELLRKTYAPDGERKFDCEFMGAKVYGRPFDVIACSLSEVPEEKEGAFELGRHLDGCRIGFDLGGSDRKCTAVMDGKVVFSEEIAWDPYFESDPQYHYDGINDTLKRAAVHLPRVDAIGGSAAGVYVNNEVRAGSLFRGVPQDAFEKRIRRIFFDLQREWGGVPFEEVEEVGTD